MEYGANFIKPSEMWKDIKPRIGKMLAAVNDIETRAEKAQEEAYQKGLSDAWEAARKIGYSLKSSIVAEIFGTPYSSQIFSGYSASEAIEKIQQYEQEQEEQIQVGDEVKNTQTDARFIVTHMWVNNHGEKGVSGFNYECSAFSTALDLVRKTGRHFPEIAEVLQKMKES